MTYLNILKTRYSLIVKYTGVIIMGAGVALFTPLFSLFLYGEDANHSKYFVIPAILALITGAIFYYSMKNKDRELNLTLKEGAVIVVFSWVIVTIFFSLPFILGLGMNFTNSIFEAVSGITTTGLSVVDVTSTPKIYLLWRSIMQFLGGAGLAVIALSSILPMQGMGLYEAEGRTDQLLPHVRKTTSMIVRIYIGYIIAGIILYVITGMTLFDAINHSIAAVSTGGFSTVPESIGHWNSLPLELATIVLMIFGTMNFATSYTLLKGKYKKFFANGEIKLLVTLIAISTPLVAFVSLNSIYSSLGESFRQSLFQMVTALSTTGFSTIDFNTWPYFANFIIIIFMIIGGGTGSTAGGIKQFRVYLVFKSIYWKIRQRFRPQNEIVENYVWRGEEKWYIKNGHIRDAANYIMLYLFTYLIGVMIFLAHGYSLEDSLFEFASALGTVGLSVGVTAANAPKMILWTETIGMFLGRLEIIVIFYAIIKIFRDFLYLRKKKKNKS
ncbi:MAG: TrkH family potassium uptake protein [Bacillota bacterium]